MELFRESLENLLGVNLKARHKNQADRLDQYFEESIIHREIQGDKIYVPLNLNRVWNQID
jgi:hypothetical protein